ncbi:MAG: hypothetical protein ACLU98_14605, partial [Desulfovibrio fairfieldensis]
AQQGGAQQGVRRIVSSVASDHCLLLNISRQIFPCRPSMEKQAILVPDGFSGQKNSSLYRSL